MTTKLTLTIDQSVISKAKKYARKNGQSVSNIVENYLKNIIIEESSPDSNLSPITKSLKGTFKAPPDFDYKKELVKALEKKYLKNG